jgi:phosphate transport system substrate-binding protein
LKQFLLKNDNRGDRVSSLTRIFRPVVLAILVSAAAAMPAAGQDKIVLVGSGSNVPLYLYEAWTREFDQQSPAVKIRYLPLGTGESIKQISHGVGDFGDGEVPLSDAEMHAAGNGLISLPAVLVGIVPIYNLPGNPELNLSGELLGDIYLGTIKNWQDPRIAKLNPGVALPNLPIKVIHRSPGKGSNYIFSDFLSKTSARFRARVGKSPSPQWPLGLDAERGQDMVQMVAQTPGAIGYVEADFAKVGDIGYGRVQNASGHFVIANPANIAAACAARLHSIPDDFRVDMTNAPGADSYPLTSFSWIYVPRSGDSPDRRKALKDFLHWALQDGQRIAAQTGYAPLPDGIAARARAMVSSLQ